MKKSFRDFLEGVVLCVLSVAIYFYSDTFDSISDIPALAKSAAYAKIWACILFILSALLVAKALRERDGSQAKQIITLPVFISCAALFLYIIALNYIGFIACSIIFLTAMITYYDLISLQPEDRAAFRLGVSCAKYFCFSLILGGLFYLIFEKILGVYLPVGSLIEPLLY